MTRNSHKVLVFKRSWRARALLNIGKFRTFVIPTCFFLFDFEFFAGFSYVWVSSRVSMSFNESQWVSININQIQWESSDQWWAEGTFSKQSSLEVNFGIPSEGFQNCQKTLLLREFLCLETKDSQLYKEEARDSWVAKVSIKFDRAVYW